MPFYRGPVGIIILCGNLRLRNDQPEYTGKVSSFTSSETGLRPFVERLTFTISLADMARLMSQTGSVEMKLEGFSPPMKLGETDEDRLRAITKYLIDFKQ